MNVVFEDKNFISVTGNTCNRGEKYASDEIQNPRRMVTSTVAVLNVDNMAVTKYLPVKTSSPISKDKIYDAMKIINNIKAYAPIKMGEVLYQNFTENGINILACKDIIL
jgi:CxxC motif-containing protein